MTLYPHQRAGGVPNSKILDDGGKGFWVPSSLGLYYFDRQTEQMTLVFHHDEANPDSLNDNSVVSIYKDRGRVLWVGTENGGLNTLNFQQEQFGRNGHRPGDPNSLSPGVVTAMYGDSNGELWVGLSPRALDRLNRRTGTITHYSPQPGNENSLGPGVSLGSVYKDASGYLWLGGWAGGGLDRFDERTGQFKHYRPNPADPASLPSDSILCIYGDRTGTLWLGEFGGFGRFNPTTEIFTNYRPNPNDSARALSTVSAIYRDRAGPLWVGTWGGMLSRFDENNQTLVNYTPDSRDPHKLQGGDINDLHEDRAGTLWVGAADGLYRFNRQDGTVTHYTEVQGLPNSTIEGILEDSLGRLWISTKKGISRFDPRTGTFRNYDVYDGLQGNEFNDRCHAQTPDGEMFFCGTHGFNAFLPQDIRDNAYVPPVVITSFKIFNRPVPIGGRSVLKKAIPYVNSLTLSYRHSVFSFEFAALSYANSQKNRYRYKLEHFDREWTEVDSKQRLATYTNLDPGTYVFRVQGSNADGVWNEQGTSLTILITPPWWRTTWFRALAVLACSLLIFGGFYIRLHELKEQEKKFREAVETMPALAFVSDPNGDRTFVNRAWLEYTGLSSQRAFGSGWQDAIHPKDLKRVMQRWRTAQQAGELLEYEVRVRRADGAYRWFQTRARPVHDKRGNILKWCAVATDIEDRKRAEQLEADLAHVNRVSTMGELAASISHELHQPIAASIVNADLVMRYAERNPPDLKEVRERASTIIEMGTMASKIIDRLRSLYKKEPPKREQIAVNQLIGEMVELLRGQATRHGVSLRADLAGEVPGVLADRVQIQQVLMNLMLNGIEAMSETGGVLTVSSNLRDDGQIEITVNDTGPGLAPGKADQIFEAFFTTKPQGSGMGLAISKSIVESHGGRIWANSDSGRGATFHFVLPSALADATPGNRATETAEPHAFGADDDSFRSETLL